VTTDTETLRLSRRGADRGANSLNYVRLTVERIRELSPILRDLESAGKIQIAGCIYDVNTGRVRFLPQPSPAPGH